MGCLTYKTFRVLQNMKKQRNAKGQFVKGNNEGNRFPEGDQGLNEAKSQGQIKRSKSINILYTTRTLFANADILPELIDNIKIEVKNGNNKNALELLKVIKEPEEQKVINEIKTEDGIQLNIQPVKTND